MTDLDKIFITSGLTVFGSVLVFVIGQLLTKLFIEPTQELKKAIFNTRIALAFHAGIINTPISRSGETSQESANALRKCSAELFAMAHTIPQYDVLAKVSRGYLPRKAAIIDASRELRGLSTYVFDTGDKALANLETIKKITARIEKNLGLEATQ